MQTAALAQKNSEATRALAMQEDILEKELGEIQKVLLAMQVKYIVDFRKLIVIYKYPQEVSEMNSIGIKKVKLA